MSGDNEQVALELTMQLSSYQQQLDKKGRRLISIQQSLHGATGGGAGQWCWYDVHHRLRTIQNMRDKVRVLVSSIGTMRNNT